jgi:hypothetical protein
MKDRLEHGPIVSLNLRLTAHGHGLWTFRALGKLDF